MRNLLAVILTIAVPMAQALELKMPAQEWVVLQSRRANTLNDLVVGVTLPDAKQEEFIRAIRRRGALTAPVPTLRSSGQFFEILGDNKKALVTVDLAKAPAGEFVINGQSVYLSAEMPVEKMLNLVGRALKPTSSVLLDALVPKAEAGGFVYVVAGVVVVILAGSLFYSSRSLSGGMNSDAVDILYAIQTGNNKATVRDFKCDEDGRLTRWEISRNVNGQWVDDRVEWNYAGAEPTVRHITDEFDCMLGVNKKLALNAHHSADLPIAKTEECARLHKAAKSVGDISVFARYVAYDKIASCCKRQPCREALEHAAAPNLSDRARGEAAATK